MYNILCDVVFAITYIILSDPIENFIIIIIMQKYLTGILTGNNCTGSVNGFIVV